MASKGQTLLESYIEELLPPDTIIMHEYHIGDRLRLDIYIPKYNIAFEYHGKQHFFYTDFFHQSKQEFQNSQLRDQKKEDLCRELGIGLTIFTYCDKITKDLVYEKILEAIESSSKPQVEAKKKPTKDNEYYQKAKELTRQRRKEQYRKYKDGIRKSRRDTGDTT